MPDPKTPHGPELYEMLAETKAPGIWSFSVRQTGATTFKHVLTVEGDPADVELYRDAVGLVARHLARSNNFDRVVMAQPVELTKAQAVAFAAKKGD